MNVDVDVDVDGAVVNGNADVDVDVDMLMLMWTSQDRLSGQMIQERIPMYLKLSLHLIYQTSLGRVTNKAVCTCHVLYAIWCVCMCVHA